MKNFKNIAQNDNNIIAAFLYGSHVYGTNHAESDNDFICVVKDKNKENPLSSFGDVTNYTTEEFINLIEQHEISILECLFTPKEKQLKCEETFSFNLDKQILRNSISTKASNSWVKCKKKFIVEQDFNPYIGKKSAWHSLRILDFGTQIAQHGKIINFGNTNDLLTKIMSLNSWEEIEQNFKKTYNEMASVFKQFAPKEQSINTKKNKP